MKSLKLFLSISLIALYLTSASTANIVQSASCSKADVQTAISLAQNGDTVMVPAGNCVWTDGLDLPNNNKITLMGAGKEYTIINGVVNFGRSGSRVTGFTFMTGDQYLLSEGFGFRLDHCKLQRDNWGDIIIIEDYSNIPQTAYGLVDNNEIINGRVNSEGTPWMLFEGNQQHQLWATNLDLGGLYSVYVEDNTFTTSSPANSQVAIDANYGGRFVFRFNIVTNGLFLTSHSSQEQGNRSARSWEIYGNSVANNTSTSIYAPVRMRGGTGVIFLNIIEGNWADPSILFDNVRSYAEGGLGAGKCDGTSAWDGNSDSTGYPCRDQIGRSLDNPQWNHNPPLSYNQAYMPAYVWLNKDENNFEYPVNVIQWSENHIKANRDFYKLVSNFNGSSGMGYGTIAQRPSNCNPGVAYWVTDQGEWNSLNPGPDGQLYKCNSPDTWELYYTPYPYPHPLREDGVTSVSAINFYPDEFYLYQNYPNPFNPSTVISWQSTIGSHQTLKIYDVLGNEVAVLLDEYKPAGSYEVEFNTSTLKHQASSGIYFYRLSAGDYNQTKSMILIK